MKKWQLFLGVVAGLWLMALGCGSWTGSLETGFSVKAEGNSYEAGEVVAIVEKDEKENSELVEAFSEVSRGFFSALGYGFLELTAGITFEDIGDGQQIVRVNPEGNLIAYTGEALGAVSSLPISGTAQTGQTLELLGLSPVEKVEAQGYGYASLEPLMTAWRIFRNLAYVFFTVIILIVGIMILFQQKFDGSLVLTVQQAIPKIILSLILVTFSYAIVGFLIDIMYLVMFLFGGLFVGTEGLDVNGLMTNNIFGLGGSMLAGGVASVWQIFAKLSWGNVAAGWGESEGILANVGGFIKWLLVDVILGLIVGAVFSVLLMIIVIIIILVNIWKLFIILLKSYVLLILNTIFAPIMLMLGALPNNQGIKKWFNAIIGNLSAFVAVFVIVVVYYFIRSLANTAGASGATTLFVPPYLIDSGIENPGGVVFAILGLGILIILPTLVEKVRVKMGAESGFLGEIVVEAKDRIINSRVTQTGSQMLGGLAQAGIESSIAGRKAGADVITAAQNRERYKQKDGKMEKGYQEVLRTNETAREMDRQVRVDKIDAWKLQLKNDLIKNGETEENATKEAEKRWSEEEKKQKLGQKSAVDEVELQVRDRVHQTFGKEITEKAQFTVEEKKQMAKDIKEAGKQSSVKKEAKDKQRDQTRDSWQSRWKTQPFINKSQNQNFLSAVKEAMLNNYAGLDFKERARHSQMVVEANQVKNNLSYPVMAQQAAKAWLDNYGDFKTWSKDPIDERKTLFTSFTAMNSDPNLGAYKTDASETALGGGSGSGSKEEKK